MNHIEGSGHLLAEHGRLRAQVESAPVPPPTRCTPPDQPIRYARIGGALYLVIIVAGIVGPLLTRDQLAVPDDPAATAHNIAASPGLWRLGIAVDVVMQLCDVPVMLIMFLLLSPVNRNIALLALLFNIVQTATLVANQLTLVGALVSTDQQALTDLAIRMYSYGEALGLIFFGFTLLAEGYLIRKSGYLPWIIGLSVQIAGVSYLVSSFLLLLAPDSANIAFLIPSFVGELSLALWLLVRGVNASKWECVSAERDGRGQPSSRPHHGRSRPRL